VREVRMASQPTRSQPQCVQPETLGEHTFVVLRSSVGEPRSFAPVPMRIACAMVGLGAATRASASTVSTLEASTR